MAPIKNLQSSLLYSFFRLLSSSAC